MVPPRRQPVRPSSPPSRVPSPPPGRPAAPPAACGQPRDLPAAPSACGGCGQPLSADEWQVLLADGARHHYDCWEDRDDADAVRAFLPASDVVRLAQDINDLRRERRRLRTDNEQLRAERDAARAGLGVAMDCIEAHALKFTGLSRAQSLRCEILDFKIEIREVLQKAEAESAELDDLRAKLQAALDRVELWQASAAVGEENPELCCCVTLRLMTDPVMTADGRTFEREAIEGHFAALAADGRPLATPQRQPLTSNALTPNHALKAVIERLLRKKKAALAAPGSGKRKHAET